MVLKKLKSKENLKLDKMKCIKAVTNIGRYKEGDRRVSIGDWMFIPKSEFKGSDNKEVIHEVVEETKKKKSKKEKK
jgi:hypothetical protein